MPYRVAADVMLHLQPINAGEPRDLRRRTLQIGKRFGDAAAAKPHRRRYQPGLIFVCGRGEGERVASEKTARQLNKETRKRKLS
jgi:hypothetical protein